MPVAGFNRGFKKLFSQSLVPIEAAGAAEADGHVTEADRTREGEAAELLESHSHFRGRGLSVECKCNGQILRLDGSLPSFYLKQLAQEALRQLQGVVRIDNQIVVANAVVEVNENLPVN